MENETFADFERQFGMMRDAHPDEIREFIATIIFEATIDDSLVDAAISVLNPEDNKCISNKKEEWRESALKHPINEEEPDDEEPDKEELNKEEPDDEEPDKEKLNAVADAWDCIWLV